MSKFKSRLVPIGKHQPRNGEFVVDLARNERWLKNFQAMKKAGIKVPLAWGHQPKAEPANEEKTKADKEYWLSKYNAGYVEDAYLDKDGTLGIVADSPAVEINDKGEAVTTATLPDGRQVKCAIAEVSGAFRDWKDGTGRAWPDSLIHVALTPLPVIANQEGFTPIPEPELRAGEVRLSLATYLAMPDEMNDQNDIDTAGGAGGEKDENPFAKEGGESEGGEGGGKDDIMGMMKELSDALATMGIMIEPGKSPKEYIQHMLTAVNTHQATKDIHGGGAGEGEGGGAGGEAEASSNEGAGAATPPQTESPPMMMSKSTYLSLADIKEPVMKAMFIDRQDTGRKTNQARINALERRRLPGTNLPAIPPSKIAKWRNWLRRGNYRSPRKANRLKRTWNVSCRWLRKSCRRRLLAIGRKAPRRSIRLPKKRRPTPMVTRRSSPRSSPIASVSVPRKPTAPSNLGGHAKQESQDR